MKQTFSFNTNCNSYNDDTVDVVVDFDEKELILSDEMNNLTVLYVDRNLIELKRFYKSIGNLIEEMEDE